MELLYTARCEVWIEASTIPIPIADTLLGYFLELSYYDGIMEKKMETTIL